MSIYVPTAFVDAFRDGVMMLAQQRGSRLRQFVDIDSGIVGKKAYYDQIGVITSAQAVSNRHGDSPLGDAPHARRSLSLTDYDDGQAVDDFDKLKMNFDPTSRYVQAMQWNFGRVIDDVIIAAATGTSLTGVSGGDSTTLASFNSSRQLIAVDYFPSGAAANSGLTLNKLRRANHIFGINDIPEDEPRYMAVSQQQLTDLLSVDEVINHDYATVKALVDGKINSYMGFQFIRTERLALNTTTDVRTCFAFTRPALKLGFGADVTARVAERPDKKFMMYAYMMMSLGATRMEEAQVVQILCDQSP